MENQRIFISTSNFKSRFNNNLNDILNGDLNGFEYFEIASGHKTDEKTISIIKKLIKEDKKGFLFHNYPFREKDNLMINLCEEDRNKKDKIINYIKEMILLTKELGENYFSFHGGFYPRKITFIEHEKYNNLFKENLLEIIKFAESQQVYIGIENHVVEFQNIDKLYLYNENQFEALFNEINNPYLMLHLDMGHLNVTSNTYTFQVEEFLEKFSNRIMTVHLHGNDGITDQHRRFGDSEYFLSHLKSMKNLKNIVIETWDQDIIVINEMVRILENVI